MPALCLRQKPKQKPVGHENQLRNSSAVLWPQTDADFHSPVLFIHLQWPPPFLSVPP